MNLTDTILRTPLKQPRVLPMSRAEMSALGWDELDILLVSGDAYVDHPSFGVALLGRWLVHHGFRTGIVSQPRWDTDEDVKVMGRPRLFAGVTSGSLDSMLAHYTAFRKKRSDDAYTPGGRAGSRPNRASIIYTNIVRRAFAGLPVLLGGIEASLRRISHYDFWTDSVRKSIILDSKATAITYGMAENSILAFAHAMESTLEHDLKTLRPLMVNIPGLTFAGSREDLPQDADVLDFPSHEDILADPQALIRATELMEQQVHQNKQIAVQECAGRLVILTPPGPPLEGSELDELAALPFTREAHPSYTEEIPAARMIQTSVNAHRGCAGGCSFCTLALHQGRRIRSRSRESILREVESITRVKGFTGSISDVGGPSANMWGAHCASDPSSCKRASCMTPAICPFFEVEQKDFVKLLRAVKGVDGVKHVRIASGWRIDLGLEDMESLGVMVREFVGGQCKIAPEHKANSVLKLMRKPGFAAFEKFLKLFDRESGKAGKEQYVIPYLMSAFPGCTDDDMRDLSSWLQARGWKPNQVQCFIPLPGTAAAAMFHAETDLKGKPIYVAKTDADRLRQHGILMPDKGRPQGRRNHGPHGGSVVEKRSRNDSGSRHRNDSRDGASRGNRGPQTSAGGPKKGGSAKGMKKGSGKGRFAGKRK